MAPRSELHAILKAILGSDYVYFQPPEDIRMVYPAIVYSLDYTLSQFADGIPYAYDKRYLVTSISRDPDSPVPDKIAMLPMCTFDRAYRADGLHHTSYKLYF